MNAKYQLTIEENVFIAKRNLVDYIWKSARLEGLGVTFPQTDAIMRGMGTNVPLREIDAIRNLKRAWQFLLETLDCPTDFSYICQLNRLVGKDLFDDPGFIRKVPVTIGGTTWIPDLPIEVNIKDELAEIAKIESPTERSITLMLHCMRRQMFLDGNKRVGMLAANHEMIMNGCGIISIPIERQVDFMEMLIRFYETNQMEPLKQYVYDYCIDGIDMKKQHEETAALQKQMQEEADFMESVEAFRRQHSTNGSALGDSTPQFERYAKITAEQKLQLEQSGLELEISASDKGGFVVKYHADDREKVEKLLAVDTKHNTPKL